MGIFDRLKKNQQEKPAQNIVREVETEDKVTVYFDDGSSMDWKKLESRKAVFNLDAKKVPDFTSDRIELEGGVLFDADDKLSYIRDGVKVFEITKRMKAFKELEEWSGCAVKKFIAERKEGDYGSFYKVWMYFGEQVASA